MNAEVSRWDDGKIGLSLGFSREELVALAARLQDLLHDPEQHFHISRVQDASCDVGDIEVYVKDDKQSNNMHLMSLAKGLTR